MIGNFPPRKCGIATFTRDTFESLRGAAATGRRGALSRWKIAPGHAYPPEVTYVIPDQDLGVL